jgi:D-beta-D-heptose 7-phosphate kinase/D-beta-D-heptose 1-phosphate adenosyltransferase
MIPIKRKITPILSSGRNQDDRFIRDFEELAEVVELLKFEGKKIVLMSGVYDLIHIGHARFLEAGKSNADVLVVGVDSDALTKIRKGPSRPLVPENERIEMLLHLRYVDIVTLYEEGKDNFECIQAIKPDFIVVSETTKDVDQRMLDQIERFNVKKILLPAQAEISTTERYRQLSLDGGMELAQHVGESIQDFLKKKGGKK